MNKVDITKGHLTILIALDDDIHLVALDKSKLAALESIVKHSIEAIVPTGVTQYELNELLNYQPKGDMKDAT